MPKVVNILTKEQAKVLQEVCDIMDSTICDKRTVYPTKIIGENGTYDCITNCEEHLEAVMDYVLTTIGAVFDFLE